MFKKLEEALQYVTACLDDAKKTSSRKERDTILMMTEVLIKEEVPAKYQPQCKLVVDAYIESLDISKRKTCKL